MEFLQIQVVKIVPAQRKLVTGGQECGQGGHIGKAFWGMRALPAQHILYSFGTSGRLEVSWCKYSSVCLMAFKFTVVLS